jgi:hypothetical protein
MQSFLCILLSRSSCVVPSLLRGASSLNPALSFISMYTTGLASYRGIKGKSTQTYAGRAFPSKYQLLDVLSSHSSSQLHYLSMIDSSTRIFLSPTVPPFSTSSAARTPSAAEVHTQAAAHHLHTSTAQAQHHTRRDTLDDRSFSSQVERGVAPCDCGGVRRHHCCCCCGGDGGGDGRRERSCGGWSSSGWLVASDALKVLQLPRSMRV